MNLILKILDVFLRLNSSYLLNLKKLNNFQTGSKITLFRFDISVLSAIQVPLTGFYPYNFFCM